MSNSTPILIKIDVEGYELDVLKGSLNVLKYINLKAIIIELNGSGANYGYSDEHIDELLISFGFKAYNYDPFIRSLLPAQLNEFNNLIYIRDLEFINQRLTSAQKFKILDLDI